jgi:hypothetical protein
LEFARAPLLCHLGDGKRVVRWMPVGMPKVKQDLADTTFYLYAPDTRANHCDGLVGPKGTGFFISRPYVKHLSYRHVYAVTNCHVATRGASIIRINLIGGGTRAIEFAPSDWQFIPKADDVCVVDVTEELDYEKDQVQAWPEEDFISEAFVAERQIGFGDDVFMLGMFADSAGDERNVPAARFGNVARMATAGAPIEQYNGALRPCHLADMRSRGGFSGSPMFLYRTPDADLTHMDFQNGSFIRLGGPTNLFVGLFGVHCGQFPEKSPLSKSKGEAVIQEGDMLNMPSGMTYVAPAWVISQLLDRPVFEESRMLRERKNKGSSAPISEDAPPLPTKADTKTSGTVR